MWLGTGNTVLPVPRMRISGVSTPAAALRTWTRHNNFKERPNIIHPRFPALAVGHRGHGVDLGWIPKKDFAVQKDTGRRNDESICELDLLSSYLGNTDG